MTSPLRQALTASSPPKNIQVYVLSVGQKFLEIELQGHFQDLVV